MLLRQMSISPDLATSLTAIGSIMDGATDPWWIIGSAAVALHGADPDSVGDVDVLLSVADARRIFPTIGIELRRSSAHALFRSSIFGRWTETALPVEFMADFRRYLGTAWVPVRPTTRQAVELDGTMVFIPERAEMETMLAKFGRPKDIERARRLATLS